MNIIDLALQGVAAVADALSITPNTMQQPSNDPTDRTEAKSGDPAQDERERIARERQAELEALAADNNRSATLKR